MSAQQGFALVQYAFGHLYMQGHGVPQDYMIAAEWYRKAAEQELEEAQYNLAGLYTLGEGVPRSGATAADWYYKAGLGYLKRGNKDKALICVERISNLEKDFGLTVPNRKLAYILLQNIYGETITP